MQLYFCDHDTFSDISYVMRLNFHDETLSFSKLGNKTVSYARDASFKRNPNKTNSIESRQPQVYPTPILEYVVFDIEKMKGSAKLLRSSKINNFTCRKGKLRKGR